MTNLATLATVLALAITAGTAGASPRLNLDDAEMKCEVKAKRFANAIYGRWADRPSMYRVNTEYRACVFGYSGQYPRNELVYKRTVIRIQDFFK